MSILLFLVGFLDKWMKSANSVLRVLRCGVGIPHSSVGPRQGMTCPRRDVAEREDLANLGYVKA